MPGPFSFRSRRHHGEAAGPIGFDVEFSRSADDDAALQYEVAYEQVNWASGRAEYQITRENLVEMPEGRVLFDRETGETPIDPVIHTFVDDQTTFLAALRTAYAEYRLRPDGLLGHVAVNVSRFGKFRLDPGLLNKPAPIPDVLAPAGGRLTPPRMQYQGEGLAGVLYFLEGTRDPRLTALVERVATAIDGFEGFEFSAVPNDFVVFSARFGDSRGVIEAPNLSAGTLSLIGWLTLLMRGDRQPVLMLEEPELGLTPRSTQAVYAAACEASTNPTDRSQVFVSSHSPRIMSWAATDYGAENVYVVEPADGAAEILTYQRLLARPEIGIDFARAMSVETANQVMHGF